MVPLLLVARDWFDVATGIAQMITALAIVAAVVFAAGTVWAIRAGTRGLAKALEGAQAELVPLLQQARSIADDVKGMTAAAAGEVSRVRALVEETTGKAEAALAAAESRLKRLDALAGIVQDEAEHAVVSVAAAVRGTTAAVESLRRDVIGDAGEADDDVDDDSDDDVDDDPDDDTGDDAAHAMLEALDADEDIAPEGVDPSPDADEAPRVRHRLRRR